MIPFTLLKYLKARSTSNNSHITLHKPASFYQCIWIFTFSISLYLNTSTWTCIIPLLQMKSKNSEWLLNILAKVTSLEEGRKGVWGIWTRCVYPDVSRYPLCVLPSPVKLQGRSCWACLSTGWKRISRNRALQKGVSLLRTKSRDKVGTVSAVGWQLLTGQGESTVFMS